MFVYIIDRWIHYIHFVHLLEIRCITAFYEVSLYIYKWIVKVAPFYSHSIIYNVIIHFIQKYHLISFGFELMTM